MSVRPGSASPPPSPASPPAGSWRILLLLVLTLVGLLVVARALYTIQVTQHEAYLERAMNQWTSDRKIERQRGTIYDRRGKELAISLRRWSLSFNPSLAETPEERREIARKLAPILDLKTTEIMEKMDRGGRQFAWIARRLEEGPKRRIEDLRIDGARIKALHLSPEYQRYYPHDSTAAHILGFVGSDDMGLEGVERAQNAILAGPPVEGEFFSDNLGNPIPVDGIIRYPQFDGRNVHLTIDLVIQASLEQALEAAVTQYNAKSASGVVVDPQTGEVLALANLPTYDLNEARRVEPDVRRNRAITDVFEPGSTFKIFSGALGLANGLVTASEMFTCPGSFALPGHPVKCHHAHGAIDYRRAIEVSCNVVAITVCQRLTPGVLYEGLRAYGFGARTGIDLPGEAAGVVRAPGAWSGLSQGMIAIGHEVSVSTIQLAMATAAMSNGGRLLVPRIVQSIRDQEGRALATFAPEVRAHPVDPSTSRLMGQIMSGSVRQGTGQRATVAGFMVSGKTGTAQISGPQGGYIRGRYNAVFIGWTPTDAPVLAMAIVVRDPDPSKGYYGGEVAAPVFGRVGTEVMRYLRIAAAGGRDTHFARPVPAPMARREGAVRGRFVEAPDFIGLTLREAHELAGRLPITLSPAGSGVASSQSVPPGTLVPLDAAIKVQFSPPGEASSLADIAP